MESGVLKRIAFIVGNVVKVFNATMGYLITFVITVCILLDGSAFGHRAGGLIDTFLPRHRVRILSDVLGRDSGVFNNFVDNGVVSSLVVKTVYFIYYLVLQVPCMTLVDIVIKIAGIVPFFKPCVKTVPDAVLVVLSDPSGNIVFLLFVVVLRRISNGVVKPGVLNRSAKLSPF